MCDTLFHNVPACKNVFLCCYIYYYHSHVVSNYITPIVKCQPSFDINDVCFLHVEELLCKKKCRRLNYECVTICLK